MSVWALEYRVFQILKVNKFWQSCHLFENFNTKKFISYKKYYIDAIMKLTVANRFLGCHLLKI